MYIHVGGAGADGGDDLVELTGPELLGCGPGNDICGHDVSGNGAGRRADLGPRCTGIRRRAAQPDDDAADDAQLAKMDVGLCHGSFEPTVAQFIIDGAFVAAMKPRNSPLATVDTDGTSS
jgi:hypothetical protein